LTRTSRVGPLERLPPGFEILDDLDLA
jgi:hypothetical protein